MSGFCCRTPGCGVAVNRGSPYIVGGMTVQTHDIAERLRAAGLRPTRQRVALARLLFDGCDRHVTAEVLHEEALSRKVPVSLATVYNTLHQFKEVGLLREVAVKAPRPISTPIPRTTTISSARLRASSSISRRPRSGSKVCPRRPMAWPSAASMCSCASSPTTSASPQTLILRGRGTRPSRRMASCFETRPPAAPQHEEDYFSTSPR